MEHELALPVAVSVAATCDALDVHDGHGPVAPVEMQLGTERLSVELLGVGASFDDEVPYPTEFDVLG